MRGSNDLYNNTVESIGYVQRDELIALLETSSYEERQRLWIKLNIVLMDTIEEYESIKANLLVNQLGIESAVNPSYKEIWKHIKRISKP